MRRDHVFDAIFHALRPGCRTAGQASQLPSRLLCDPNGWGPNGQVERAVPCPVYIARPGRSYNRALELMFQNPLAGGFKDPRTLMGPTLWISGPN